MLKLSGIVYKTPIHKVSPSGIPHCQFILEHKSIQEEAGFLRQVWCRISIITSGKKFLNITHKIVFGSKIIVEGFIHCHQWRNDFNKLVLHVTSISFIESGD